MKKQLFAAFFASAIASNTIAASADSDGYITKLFPPVSNVIYKSGTPNSLNSGVAGSMIPTVAPGETLRIQFVIPAGGTTAGIGGTSNLWNTGAKFGFFNCNPGKASVAQSQLSGVSGGLSLRIQRPSNVPIDKPFFSYFLIHNPTGNGYDFKFGRFTQNVSIGDGDAYSDWVNDGRCLPSTDQMCSFASGGASTPNKGTCGSGGSVVVPPTTQNYSLIVNKTGSGTVTSSPAAIDCGTTCSAQFTGGMVTLTATPSADSSFSGWSGACSGSSTKCYVSMNSYKSVGATFVSTPTESSVITATSSLKESYKAGSVVDTVLQTEILAPQAGKTLNLWVWLENVNNPNTIYYLDSSGNLVSSSKKIFKESVKFTAASTTLTHPLNFSIPFDLTGEYMLKAVYVPAEISVDNSAKWESRLFESPITITKISLPELTVNGLNFSYGVGESVNISLVQNGDRSETVDLWIAIKGPAESDPFQFLNSQGIFVSGSFNAQGIFESSGGTQATAYKKAIDSDKKTANVAFIAPISEFTIYAAYAKANEDLLKNLGHLRSEIAISEKTNFRADLAFDMAESYNVGDVAEIVIEETQRYNRSENMDLWVSVKEPNNLSTFLAQGIEYNSESGEIVSVMTIDPEPFRANLPPHSDTFHFHLKGELEGVYTVCASYFETGKVLSFTFLNNEENSTCEQVNFVESGG